jgi:hypothetical protein
MTLSSRPPVRWSHYFIVIQDQNPLEKRRLKSQRRSPQTCPPAQRPPGSAVADASRSIPVRAPPRIRPVGWPEPPRCKWGRVRGKYPRVNVDPRNEEWTTAPSDIGLISLRTKYLAAQFKALAGEKFMLRFLRPRPPPNSIRRRQQRAFAPALPPPCAAHSAIAAQLRADPDRDK